ncbi:hypothetical protein HUG15_21180 [Salicibibacter cibarius]|uniref:Uncharacterized protein n=1 Tax=Salicibibacter cibarius TaxID=2743000 RepID=A0A7T6Z6S5_9BACI|nr:hypothetical protein [Salicibibacter cibarius]QQK77841.1 hypothetical protein HUG15_21180 [Salicibibacter cibarius]
MNKKEIHEALMNYKWMMNVLITKRQEMTGVSQAMVSKYGIEATLPSGSTPSDPVYYEIQRMERYDTHTKSLKWKVSFIQRHSTAITDIKDQIILDELLNGNTLRQISKDHHLSVAAVKRRKDRIIEDMYVNAESEQCLQT